MDEGWGVKLSPKEELDNLMKINEVVVLENKRRILLTSFFVSKS